MNNPYREPDDDGSLRARLAKAEANIAALQSPMRRAAWAGWRWLGWALLAMAPIALLCALLLRGSAWGVDARANSEREALRWGRTYWPTLTAARVYCPATLDTEPTCTVRFPDNTTWTVACDDDIPSHNDGCDNPAWKHPDEPSVPTLVTPKRDGGVDR